FLMPLRNSSVWIRSSTGNAFGDSNDPFASFYFGAFGNNWVDKGDFSRYREYYSFPGARLNEIGANNFVKSMVEWDLPPVRFRNVGNTMLYANWARLALFSGALAANLGNARAYVDAGAQIDVRLVLFTYTKSTLSAGFGVARDRAGHTGSEAMISLKIY